MLLIKYFATTVQQVAQLPYSEFETYLREGKISEVAVSDRYIQGRFREALASVQTQFITTRVEPAFAEQLQRYNVAFTGQIESTLLRDLLSWVIPMALFIGVWVFVIRRMGAGAGGGLLQRARSGLGRSRN